MSQGTGHLRGASTIEGLLVRDLQLQPKSRFAFFLRPLPARAEELTLHATKFRTQMLRVVRQSPARRRYAPFIPPAIQSISSIGSLWEVVCSILKFQLILASRDRPQTCCQFAGLLRDKLPGGLILSLLLLTHPALDPPR